MSGRHFRSRHERGYDLRWVKARRAYLATHPHCLGCDAIGLTVMATAVDHVVPHLGNQQLFWDVNNWQPACYWHHNAIKARLENEWQACKVSVAALALDSPEAVKLSRRLRRVPVGLDGYPA